MKSQEKVPKTTENSCYWVLLMVPVTGLEPVRHRWRWILSPLRLPFHHTGNCIFKFPLQNRSSENGGQNRRAIQKTLHIHFQKVLVFQGKSHTPEDLANQILSPPRLPIPTHRQAPLQYSTDSGKMQEKVFPPPGKTHERVFPGEGFCGCFIRRRVPRSDIRRSQSLPGCAVRGRSRCRGTAEKAQCPPPVPRRRLSAFPDFPEG